MLAHYAINLSLILYLVFYLPQLFHNIKHMASNPPSFLFHTLMVVGAGCDVFYAVGQIHQWQYLVTSIVMLMCMVVQHLQFAIYHPKIKMSLSYKLLCVFMILVVSCTLLAKYIEPFPVIWYLSAGWMMHVAYGYHLVPQIIQHYNVKSTLSLSMVYIFLSLLNSSLDWVSAIGFAWPEPSQMSIPIMIALHFVIVWQWFLYHQKTKRYLSTCG